MIEWLAVGIGLAGGLALAFAVLSRTLAPLASRAGNAERAVKFSLAGAVAAAVPAVLLAIVLGAPLGAPWGLPGMAAGVALVFALVLLAGVFAGVLLARYFT